MADTAGAITARFNSEHASDIMPSRHRARSRPAILAQLSLALPFGVDTTSQKKKKTADKKGISAKTSAKKGKERKTIARNEKGNDVVKAVTNFELESVKYAYKKIKGIDGKCSQMIRVGNTILVATNNGLFLVQDSSAAKLIPDAISYLCLSNDKKHFFAGTDDKKLFFVI